MTPGPYRKGAPPEEEITILRRRPRWLAWWATAGAVIGLGIGHAALLYPGSLAKSHGFLAFVWGLVGFGCAAYLLGFLAIEKEERLYWLPEDGE